MTGVPSIEAMQRTLSSVRTNLFTGSASVPTAANAWAMAVWNANVSAALWAEIGWVEVVVRNAVHVELTKLSSKKASSPQWWHHLQVLGIDGAAAAAVEATLKTLDEDHKAHTPSYVVAGLPFGFWGRVLSMAYHRRLWSVQLHRAFPHGTRPADVAEAMRTVHELRNRIAHHRPICKGKPDHNIAALSKALTSIRTLTEWVAPELAPHVRTVGIEALIAARP